jgi:sugar phosphate isomerase/epimerase
MKLAISNIAWAAGEDERVYGWMAETGLEGLEIAPTRIFPEAPYDQLSRASEWARKIREKYHFAIPSMQSIWYGRKEKLFGSAEERRALTEYTQRAILFAEAVGCRNLVFGCPRNRNLEEGMDRGAELPFFREIGDFAAAHGTVIGLEANPPLYHTNYINDTASAIRLIRAVGSPGLKLNLDVGTMLACGERVSLLEGNADLIQHVHLSEPGLKPIEDHALQEELAAFLARHHYRGFISVEMSRPEEPEKVYHAMKKLRRLADAAAGGGKDFAVSEKTGGSAV